MDRKYKCLIFTAICLFLPLLAMILDLIVPIYKLPRYLVIVSIYIGGIGFIISMVMFIAMSLKQNQENEERNKGKKITVLIIGLLLISNLYLYRMVSGDFYREGWYGEAISKEIRNGKYYIIFHLDGQAKRQEMCTQNVYNTIVTGRKYMAKSYGNTNLNRNVIYKIQEEK